MQQPIQDGCRDYFISGYVEMKTGATMHTVLKLAGKVLTHKVTNTKIEKTAYVKTTIDNPETRARIVPIRSLGNQMVAPDLYHL